jgi:hypothetical protein
VRSGEGEHQSGGVSRFVSGRKRWFRTSQSPGKSGPRKGRPPSVICSDGGRDTDFPHKQAALQAQVCGRAVTRDDPHGVLNLVSERAVVAGGRGSRHGPNCGELPISDGRPITLLGDFVTGRPSVQDVRKGCDGCLWRKVASWLRRANHGCVPCPCSPAC